METTLLPRRFQFGEAERSLLLFSDGTRINIDSQNHYVTLVEQSNGKYPLDTNLWVASQETTPGTWWRWELLLAGVYHSKVSGALVTAHQLRLHDGTDHYYWDGATWSLAGVSDWNTEAEVNAHIKTFPSATLRVVVNLSTTDGDHTPILRWLNVAWSARDVCSMDDIIYRSLVPLLMAVRPVADYPITLGATASTINLLTGYPLDAKYDIAGIDSVFDHTADPTHRTDLLSSYNPATKVITLTGPVTAGHVVWIRFSYSVPVITIQSTDYTELAAIPAILLENIRTVEWKEYAERDVVYDYATSESIAFPPALAGTLRLDIIATTPGTVDTARLQEAIERCIAANPILTSAMLDEGYRMRAIDHFTDTSNPDFANVREARMTIEIMDVKTFVREAQTGGSPIKVLRLTGDVEVDIPIP